MEDGAIFWGPIVDTQIEKLGFGNFQLEWRRYIWELTSQTSWRLGHRDREIDGHGNQFLQFFFSFPFILLCLIPFSCEDFNFSFLNKFTLFLSLNWGRIWELRSNGCFLFSLSRQTFIYLNMVGSYCFCLSPTVHSSLLFIVYYIRFLANWLLASSSVVWLNCFLLRYWEIQFVLRLL